MNTQHLDKWISRTHKAEAEVKKLIGRVRELEETVEALDFSWETAKQRWHTAEVKLDSQQAKIDMLMLEYCPDEMTPEQLYEWGKHQVEASGDGLEDALE